MTTYDQWDIASGTGVTALAVAMARAIETCRPDGLVRDPYAAGFITASELPAQAAEWPGVDGSAEWKTPARGSWWDSFPTYVGVRTRFFDTFFAEAATSGIRQVVLIGSGLDTRAFRLDWPADTVLFEIDQALVLRFKDHVLGGRGVEARCTRHVVAADLRDDWPSRLRAAGFDPARPTAWLVEGLLPFLPARSEHDLFAHISGFSAPRSRIAVEAVAGKARDEALYPPFEAAMEANFGVTVSTVWNTERRTEPIDALRGNGWTVALERIAVAGRRYGRAVHGVMSVPAEHSMLLTATM